MKIFLSTILAAVLNVIFCEVAQWEDNFVPSPDGSINLKIIITLGAVKNDTIQNTTSNVVTISPISGEIDLNATENAEAGNTQNVLSNLLTMAETGQLKNDEQTKTGENDKNRLQLMDECIKAIESNQFDIAEKKLSGIENDTYIFLIVKQVYDDGKDNFDTLLIFGNTLQNVGQRFILFKALYNELNNDRDPVKLLRLIRSLHGKVLLAMHGPESEHEIKEEVESLISTITKDFISLQLDKDIDPKSVVELAFAIKEILNYESLNSDLKKEVEKIRDKLPKSVKNMAFLSKVCIADIKYKGFLYADQSNTNDTNDRKILIGNGGYEPCKKEWTFEHIHDDVVRIKNHVVDEVMYTSDEKFGNPDNPQLSKRLRKNDPSRGISEDEEWFVEPVGDNVRLKNVAKNSYSINGFSVDGKWEMVDIFEIS